MDWFRWHHGSVTDPKFPLVAKKAGVRLPDVLAVWAFLLEQASASEDRGRIGEIDTESLDLLFGLEDGQCARVLDAMAARGLIADGRVASWEKRQPKREREDDTAAERKRRQREREADQRAVTDGVTPCHAESHHVTPRGEEIREEEIKEEKKKSSDARASRLPADWQPTVDDIEFCRSERPELNPESVATQFRDYWIAQPGAKGRKADWPATWRNWVRNQRASPRASPQYQTRLDQQKQILDELTGRSRDRPHDPDDPFTIETSARVVP